MRIDFKNILVKSDDDMGFAEHAMLTNVSSEWWEANKGKLNGRIKDAHKYDCIPLFNSTLQFELDEVTSCLVLEKKGNKYTVTVYEDCQF